MYIIVWRNSHRDPCIDTDFHGFKESFSSYEDAREYAENTMDDSGHFCDYQIYQEVNS